MYSEYRDIHGELHRNRLGIFTNRHAGQLAGPLAIQVMKH